MTTRYIELNSSLFDAFLTSKGFASSVQGSEIVYTRAHEVNKNLFVKVYSSISANVSIARECGGDAIRIVAIYNDGNRSFGIFKSQRVYRTGSQEAVHQRTYERMREAYMKLNEWRRRER